MPTTTPTHYELLGVDPAATPKAIKRAWRERVGERHPDRADGTRDEAARTQATAALNAAYAVLSDPTKRADYDLTLARSQSQPPPPAAARATTPRTGSARAARSRPSPPPSSTQSTATGVARAAQGLGAIEWLFRSTAGQWTALGLLLLGCLASTLFGNGLLAALGNFMGLAFYLLAAQSIIARRISGPTSAVFGLLLLFFGLLFGIGGNKERNSRR